MNFRNTQAGAVDTSIPVSSPIISSRVSLGFCEKKRWKESEWKHQRYHIRTSHQYIFHILYSASKCISCSTVSFTVRVQCSFQECIYRFQQERRGAKYVASSAPVSLLHPRGPLKMKSTSWKLIQFQKKNPTRNFFTSFSREPYLIKRRHGCGKKRILLFCPNTTNSSPNLPNQACHFGPLKSDQIKGRIPQRFMTTTSGNLLAGNGPGRFFLEEAIF